MSDEAPLVRSPLLLLGVSALAVGVFVLALSVAAFLLRHAPTATPGPQVTEPTRPTTMDPSGGEGPVNQRPAVGGLERQSASTLVAPVFPACYREARARDPSLAREVQLTLALDTRPTGGTITALHLDRGGSPYLAACLRAQLVGAGFPAASDGVGEVTWRVQLDGDTATLIEKPE